MSDAMYDPEGLEKAVAARMRQRREREMADLIPDLQGISRAMIDKMIEIYAEALSTGATDIRHILYCAYREARKIESTRETKTDGEGT